MGNSLKKDDELTLYDAVNCKRYNKVKKLIDSGIPDGEYTMATWESSITSYDDKMFKLLVENCPKDHNYHGLELVAYALSYYKKYNLINYVIMTGRDILVEDFYEYPRNEIELMKLVNLGLKDYKQRFSKIAGIEKLFKKIDDRKFIISVVLENKLLPELIMVAIDYVVE